MKNQNNIKQWIALTAGLAFGWFTVHLIVTNWEKIKAFIM